MPREKLQISSFLLASGNQGLINEGKFRGTDVVIKSCPQTKESYLAHGEVRLLDRVRHLNIISTMAVSEGLQDYYIIMEFLQQLLSF